MNNFIGLIPARSGSKGIPNKNMRKINGKPLLWYTIKFALSCGLFERVFISTDSREYEEYALKEGIESLGIRSPENSRDTSKSTDVIEEFLSKYDDRPSALALLQPTSPLRYNEDVMKIQEMYGLMDENSSIISAFKIDEPHPYKAFFITGDTVKPLYSIETMLSPRQSLEPCYALDGAFYLFTPEFYYKNKSLINENTKAYQINKKRVNIDSFEDLFLAQKLLNSYYEY